MKPWLLALVLCATAFGQEMSSHNFWDRQQKISFITTAGIRALDAATTCRNLSVGGQERWLPVKSCAGVSAWMAGSQAGQTGFTYLLHRSGHHKMERWWPWISVSSNAVGIGYTFSHWSIPKKHVATGPCVSVFVGSGWQTRCPQ